VGTLAISSPFMVETAAVLTHNNNKQLYFFHAYLSKVKEKGRGVKHMKDEKEKSLQESTPAFFFLPDISGFTNFIKNTNLKEGVRLIHDLLEIIIDSNILNLEIAEIQGDAIWF